MTTIGYCIFVFRQNQIKHVNVQSDLTVYVCVILSSCLMAKWINSPHLHLWIIYPVDVWAIISSLLKKLYSKS